MSACWKCAAPLTGDPEPLFCASCSSIQPPPNDYFAIFGIPENLNLSVDDLQQRFYALSRQLHPDRFGRRSDTERQYSLDASSILNDAYRALRDPVKRAEYVLKRHGFDIGEQRSNNVPPELLEEVFELNMALEEMRGGDESARPQLETARGNFVAMQEQIDAQLQELFRKYDDSRASDDLTAIRALLNRRKYVQNLVNEVGQALACQPAEPSLNPK